MKKSYALTLGLLLGTSGLFAQDLNWGDFENGSKGIWGNEWGGTISIVANPTISTEKSMLFTAAAAYQGPVINWENAGVVTSYYKALEVDVYPLSDGQIQFVTMGSTSKAVDFKIQKDVTANSWQHLVFDLSSLTAFDYKQLALQYFVNANCYYDNIKLVSTNADPYTIENFELLNNWSGYGSTNTIVADPVNSSDKVLSVVTTETADWKIGLSKDYATKPVLGKQPLKVKVNVYNTVACTNFKLAFEDALTSTNTGKVELYNAIATTNQWVELVYDFSAVASATWDYSRIVLAPKESGTYYIGDIVVEYTSSKSNAVEEFEAAKNNIYSTANAINVVNAEGSTVEVYSLAGVKISAEANISSAYSVNVPVGLYVVSVNGKTTKVLVK